ncbi:DegV family protein [Tyzzerella sp. OttesenSCG-928-J15]|nr:DegV family protein [Tyzzerella sp. OttesenSCG-928-J15]
MSEYVIITDSATDLNQELVDKANVHVVPLSFVIDGNTYHDFTDHREMEPKVFYDMLRNKHTATTNAVNVNEYVEAITPYLNEGKDALLIVFSSGLSSTYSSAVIAAESLREEYPDRKILVVDSLSASMGQGLLVWLAAKEKEKGKTIDEVCSWVEENKLKICHKVTVDDLDFLKRGGRISGVSAAVGGVLNIKPMIHVDNEGRLINIQKVRGRKASLKTLVEMMKESAFKNIKQTVFISHGDCIEDVQYVCELVKENFSDAEIFINYIGPVIGAHTGPNVVALFYQGEPR